MKKLAFLIISFAFCLSCNNEQHKKEKAQINLDTASVKDEEAEKEIVTSEYYDSIAKIKIDTSTLEGKIKFIYNKTVLDLFCPIPLEDTLFDLNYDNYEDIIINYYGTAGTGMKNYVVVYTYNNRGNFFMYDSLLSRLANPSFYIKKKKITGFYLANGSGSGVQLEWMNKKWDTTMFFYVDNQGEASEWEIEYPKIKTKKNIKRTYEYIPPEEILETVWE